MKTYFSRPYIKIPRMRVSYGNGAMYLNYVAYKKLDEPEYLEINQVDGSLFCIRVSDSESENSMKVCKATYSRESYIVCKHLAEYITSIFESDEANAGCKDTLVYELSRGKNEGEMYFDAKNIIVRYKKKTEINHLNEVCDYTEIQENITT